MSTVADLNCEPAATISPNASLDAALELLLDCEATELYVVDEQDRLLGVVPDYALLKARCNGSWSDTNAAQIMSPFVVCFTSATNSAEVMKYFRESHHSRAAIVDHGRLVGQITRKTVLRSLGVKTQPAAPRPKFLGSELARNALTLRGLHFA